MVKAKIFRVRTDHKRLVYAFRRPRDNSPTQFYQPIHEQDRALSRISEVCTATETDPEELAPAQEQDSELRKLQVLIPNRS